jgi:hypothetical protein
MRIKRFEVYTATERSIFRYVNIWLSHRLWRDMVFYVVSKVSEKYISSVFKVETWNTGNHLQGYTASEPKVNSQQVL